MNSMNNMENLQKRGRPKLEEISSLIKEGAQSKSPIRCRFCKRAFPREKSLQAHQRIHTGERPYRCTHPGCHKSFVQSGQLRTHQRLHTGEKPFRCNECKNRFTHANRRCPDHPNAGLIRDESLTGAAPVANAACYSPSSSCLSPSLSPSVGSGIGLTPPSKAYHRHHKTIPVTPTTPVRSALSNYDNNLSYLSVVGGIAGGIHINSGSRCYERRDEILGALALIELSRCH